MSSAWGPGGSAVGGPATRAWLEGTLTRARELEALCEWARTNRSPEDDIPAPAVDAMAAGVASHLDAARQAALRGGFRPRNGARLERAISNLDAAEALILNLAPASYVLGQMPSLLNHVQRHLDPKDPRRTEMERMAQLVGVKEPTHARVKSDARERQEALEEVRNERGSIASAFRGASSASLREQTRVRTFRNVVVVTSCVMCLAVAGLAVVGALSPTSFPLCFQPTVTPSQRIVVCPTDESGPLPAEPAAEGQAMRPLDDEVDHTAHEGDMALILGIGATAATLSAAAAIRRVRGSSEPYGVPVALALLKVPTGAITAVLGLLLMRGAFVPGLSALDSSAQIVAWAIVFGYAQQLFTRFVDQQGANVLDQVRGGGATTLAPASAPAPA